jgi:hypothetical protein
MNEQPEALRLADELAIQDQCDFYKVCEEAALELRWLHEENERLRRDYEKIVEAVVNECIGVLNKRYMGDNNREDFEVRRCVEDLKKHFGVE